MTWAEIYCLSFWASCPRPAATWCRQTPGYRWGRGVNYMTSPPPLWTSWQLWVGCIIPDIAEEEVIQWYLWLRIHSLQIPAEGLTLEVVTQNLPRRQVSNLDILGSRVHGIVEVPPLVHPDIGNIAAFLLTIFATPPGRLISKHLPAPDVHALVVAANLVKVVPACWWRAVPQPCLHSSCLSLSGGHDTTGRSVSSKIFLRSSSKPWNT